MLRKTTIALMAALSRVAVKRLPTIAMDSSKIQLSAFSQPNLVGSSTRSIVHLLPTKKFTTSTNVLQQRPEFNEFHQTEAAQKVADEISLVFYGYRPKHWTSVLSPISLEDHPIKQLNIILREATGKGDLYTVPKIVLDVRLHPSFKCHYLANVVHVAAINGHVQLAKLLLENGALVDERYGDVKEAWRYREQINNNNEVENGDGPTPLLFAVMFQQEKVAEILILNKADVNLQATLRSAGDPEFLHYSNVAPLHYAAMNGHVELVNLLLRNNADIDIQNGFGETPLLFAVWKGRVDVVKILLEKGADPMKENGWGCSLSSLTESAEIKEMLKAVPSSDRKFRH